jgi:starvation-inducible DNA-binding protein
MMIQTHNDLKLDTRKKVAALLNARLADTLDLYSHAKQAHWNVRGHHFIALHELFDRVAAAAVKHGDQIAERAGQLGSGVDGTVRAAAKTSTLREYPLQIANGEEHVLALAESMSEHGKNIREGIDLADDAGDADTADILTEISRELDELLWFVESHLEPAKGGTPSKSVKESSHKAA